MTFFVFSVLPAPDSPLVGERLFERSVLRDQDTLALPLLPDLLPCPFRNREDVWRILLSASSTVLGNDARSVYRQIAVRVQRNEE